MKQDTGKIQVEIRAAEGGDDSNLLVEQQFIVYEKLCSVHCL